MGGSSYRGFEFPINKKLVKNKSTIIIIIITEPPSPTNLILNDLKGNENCFKLVGGSNYRGFEFPQVDCHSQDEENINTDQELMN